MSESVDRCTQVKQFLKIITTAVRSSSRTDLYNIVFAFLSVFAGSLDLGLGFEFMQYIVRHYFGADEPSLEVCMYGTSSLHHTYTQMVLNPS